MPIGPVVILVFGVVVWALMIFAVVRRIAPNRFELCPVLSQSVLLLVEILGAFMVLFVGAYIHVEMKVAVQHIEKTLQGWKFVPDAFKLKFGRMNRYGSLDRFGGKLFSIFLQLHLLLGNHFHNRLTKLGFGIPQGLGKFPSYPFVRDRLPRGLMVFVPQFHVVDFLPDSTVFLVAVLGSESLDVFQHRVAVPLPI